MAKASRLPTLSSGLDHGTLEAYSTRFTRRLWTRSHLERWNHAQIGHHVADFLQAQVVQQPAWHDAAVARQDLVDFGFADDRDTVVGVTDFD